MKRRYLSIAVVGCLLVAVGAQAGVPTVVLTPEQRQFLLGRGLTEADIGRITSLKLVKNSAGFVEMYSVRFDNNPTPDSFALSQYQPGGSVNIDVPAAATGINSTAVGGGAEASASASSAFGAGASATADGATASGALSNASGLDSSAYGFASSATATDATAIGDYSLASSDKSTAIGAYSLASDDSSTAIGYRSSAPATFSTANGSFSSANGFGSTAIGYNSSTVGTYSSAFGYNATAEGVYCVALGAFSSCTESSTASFGSATGLTRRLVNVSAGQGDTDAVNMSQLSQLSNALGGTSGYNAFGTYNGWSVPLKGVIYNTVYDALVSLDGRVTTLENTPSGGTGAQGPAGQDGKDGKDGAQGPAGQDGKDGKDGSNASVQAGKNIGVVVHADGVTTTVSLADQVQLSDQGSVQVGGTTVNGEGLTIQGGPSVTTTGVDAGNRRVTSVADGRIEQGSTDAVNGGQLYQAQQDWDDRWQATNARVDRLDDKINALGAKSAAMAQMAAASMPLAVGEAAVTAGVGFSSNKSALAIGYRVRMSERTSLSAGFAVGGGSSAMAGLGVQINLGR